MSVTAQRKAFATLVVLAGLVFSVACTSHDSPSYKDNVKKALEQAELKDVTVSEDKDKNTITLGGTLHSDDAKAKAAGVAKAVVPTSMAGWSRLEPACGVVWHLAQVPEVWPAGIPATW